MSDAPAVPILAWFHANSSGTVDDVVGAINADTAAILEGLETLLELDLIAPNPRHGTYSLTRRGRIVTARFEGTDERGLREVTAVVERDAPDIDTTVGP